MQQLRQLLGPPPGIFDTFKRSGTEDANTEVEPPPSWVNISDEERKAWVNEARSNARGEARQPHHGHLRGRSLFDGSPGHRRTQTQ